MVLGKKNLTMVLNKVVRNIPIKLQPAKSKNLRRFTGISLFFVASNITPMDFYYDVNTCSEYKDFKRNEERSFLTRIF